MAALTLEQCSAGDFLGRLLRRTDRMMTLAIERRFPDDSLGFVRWVALRVIYNSEICTAGALARDLGITTGATTRLIDQLQGRDLIERVRGCTDRRVIEVRLTALGREVVTGFAPTIVDTWNDAVREFDQSEIEQLSALLGKLLKSFTTLVDNGGQPFDLDG